MLYAGIDLHKRWLVIHTLDADGVTTREVERESDRGGMVAYFATLAGSDRGVANEVSQAATTLDYVYDTFGRPAFGM